MSLAQLESFVAVAEEAHLTRAALRLRISQPPLTRRIKDLEWELGVELFARTRSGMQLSPAGEKLLPQARSILREIAQAHASLMAFRVPNESSCVPDRSSSLTGSKSGA